MNKIDKLIALSAVAVSLTLSARAHAGDSFAEKCPDIPTCAKVVSELLGQKYIYDHDVVGKVMSTPNTELTKENAELLFTAMLDTAGFSRVPAGQPGTFRILRQRDARDLPIPFVSADQRIAPDLPENWDLYTLKYAAQFPEGVEHIARSSRSFMPANSRIIADELSGTLLITDTAMNLKKIYALVKGLDQKPSAEIKKRWAEEEQMRHEERMQAKGGDEHHLPPVKPATSN